VEGRRGSAARVRTPQGDAYRSALDAAIAGSAIARFPVEARAELVARGTRLDAPARAVLYREGDPAFSGIVVRGVLRIFVSADDGREFTLLWARPREWLGYALVAGGPMDVCAQALTDATIHVLPAELLRSLARADPVVAWEFSREVAARLRQVNAIVRMLAFMDLRQRIAQRLLELAFRQPAGTSLVAAVSQQELADAVGSPRTSVARVLADLRAEGLVRTVPTGVEVVRPERLVPGGRALSVA
jgi:CRP-like cAMP-binding protein